MIEDPTLFAFSGVGTRAVEIDKEPWFVAKDVAQVLGCCSYKRCYSDALQSRTANDYSKSW
jgi:prophage antirepressor-like protein